MTSHEVGLGSVPFSFTHSTSLKSNGSGWSEQPFLLEPGLLEASNPQALDGPHNHHDESIIPSNNSSAVAAEKQRGKNWT